MERRISQTDAHIRAAYNQGNGSELTIELIARTEFGQAWLKREVKFEGQVMRSK
jgi:hypothetical protein